MKRMLINATQPEELRVAMVDGQKLYNLDIEIPSREQKKSNIYKARVTRVEPSLEAVFVDFGSERHGFLPFKEITSNYLDSKAVDDQGRAILKDAIREGQELIVQVEKEERGSKGAALTTKIGLAGRYLVLMPTDPRAGGVSRRIEGDDRSEMREVLNQLAVPEDMGVIVRTAGVDRSAEELNWDLTYLMNVWKAVVQASQERTAPFLIYQESNVIIRALRDHYQSDIGEILIDEETVYTQAHNFLQLIMPNEARKLKKYSESVPLFNRFQIESQIESAFQRSVTLPSGGAIVIDHAEALTAIDINSARATKGSDIEETALNTNLEAADEIARQLRLRDLGGLIVIDFIDMMANRNQREVENRLRDALKLDRARVRIGRISRFGLMEMSRQRLQPSIGEATLISCPRCSGHGTIRSIESLSLAILRLVEEEAMKENTSRVIAQVPVDVATFLINEKREMISEIEARNTVDTLIVPNVNLETPHYLVERIRISDMGDQQQKHSFELATAKNETFVPEKKTAPLPSEQPAVKDVDVIPDTPVPKQKKPGLFAKMFKALFGESDSAKKHKKHAAQPSEHRSQGNRPNRDNRDRDRNQNRDRDRGRRNNRGQRQDHRDRDRNQDRDRDRKPSSAQQTPQPSARRDQDGDRSQNRDRGHNRDRDRNRDRNRDRQPRREGSAEGDNRNQGRHRGDRNRDREQQPRAEASSREKTEDQAQYHNQNTESRAQSDEKTMPQSHGNNGNDARSRGESPAPIAAEPVRTEPVHIPAAPTENTATEKYHTASESRPRAHSPRVVPSNTAGVYSIVKPEQQADTNSAAKPEAAPSESETN
jgi:ribonuclease E